MDPNKDLRGHEEWRKSKSLGSLVDEVDDMDRRIILSSVAMNNLFSFWDSMSIGNDLKIKLYRAYVKSILLYNSGTWSDSPIIMSKLDVAHRKHMRWMAGLYYPNKISNEKLYRLFSEIPISKEKEKRRGGIVWTRFKNASRSPGPKIFGSCIRM